jgi:hypothetical protein
MTPGASLLLLFGESGVISPAPGPPPPAPRRDGPAYQAIVVLLESTGEFDEGWVTTSRLPAQQNPPADVAAWAHVQQTGARVSPGGNTAREFREATYRLTVELRLPEDVDLYDATDRVEAAIRNVLLAPANRAYAGYCLPDHSRLGGARYDYAASPTVRLALDGTFAYVADLAAGGYKSDS